MLKKTIRWTVTLAWAAGVFYLSFTPSLGAEIFPHQDKVAHFVMYAGLAFLLVWSLRVTSLKSSPYAPALAAGCAVLYGALNEAGQLLVEYRSAEIADIAVNAAGAALGAYAGMFIARALDGRRERKGIREALI